MIYIIGVLTRLFLSSSIVFGQALVKLIQWLKRWQKPEPIMVKK